MSENKQSRTILKNVSSQEQPEGDGAIVRRSIGRDELPFLDPFLMLDEFQSSDAAGFPDHPHRGFETVTYMLEGTFCHEDFNGHKFEISSGDLQWMTAGKGIVHCEVPKQDGKMKRGLQLWVNLRSTDKMCEPNFQELLAKNIPKITRGGVTAIVIAGEAFGVKSPVYTKTPTMFLDFFMKPNSELNQDIPAGWNGFVYTLDGRAKFGKNQVLGEPHSTLALSNKKDENIFTVKTDSESSHFVLICGQPLKEPIARSGPFVMNTKAQLNQAFSDYQNCVNGFEKARLWQSDFVRNQSNASD